MNAAAYVGRMGVLAVALGVGAAVASGNTVAWADGSGDAGSAAHGTASHDTSAPGANAPASTAPGSTGSSSTARSKRASLRPATTADRTPGSGTPSSSKSGKSAAARAAASGSGGALTRATTVDKPAGSTAQATSADTAAPAPAATAVNPSRVALSTAAVTVAPAVVATAPATAAVLSVPVTATAPVVTALPTDAVQSAAPPVLSRLLAVFELVRGGLGSTPRTPPTTPAAWMLAAWVRREFDPAPPASRAASTTATSAPIALAAAVVTSPTTLPSAPVGWVTGQANTGYPGLNWPQTNNTARQEVWGTDLGILWENGLTGNIQLAFGDTFSGPNMTGDWRSNILLLSRDTNLSNGLSLLPTDYAYQFIPSAPGALFPILSSEVTIIPTSAVSVNNQQYVNYMSVKSWDTPGRWTTNYSAISVYDQATDKWVLAPSTIRSAGWFRSSTPYVAGNQNFQQAAYVLQPADQVPAGGTQYLYAFGTPSGRAGSAYLSRVPADSVTDLSKYEYWDGGNWVADRPAVAAPVLGDSTRSTGLFGPIIDLANNPNFFCGWFAGLTGAKTGGNVSEMSVQYNDYLKKYVVLYGNGNNDVILRTADQPEGPWSDPVTIATSARYPGLYAPMIHPWSGSGKLVDNNGQADVNNLYWDMSLWGNYNVVLMKTDLTPLKTTVV